jgi:hypothetical protein
VGWIESKIEEKIEHIGAAVSLEGERTRIAMAAGLAETRNGLRVDGAAYRSIPAAGGLVYNGTRRLVGWSARETGGTNPVNVDLYDGRSPGDFSTLVATFHLAAGDSKTTTIMPAGVSFGEGLYAVVSGGGTLSATAWIGAVD